MPWVGPDERSNAFFDVAALGPVAQSTVSLPTAIPTPIGVGNTWNSGLITADGFRALSVGCTSTQTGNLTVTRFIDVAGTVQQGAASTAALTAGTAAVLNVTDGLPFAAFTIAIQNTGGAGATISPFAVLLNAA